LVWNISKKNQFVKNIYGSKNNKKVVLPVRVEVSYDDRYVLEVAGENFELGAPSEVADPALDSVDAAERFRNFWVAVLCFLGFYVEKPTKAPSPGRFRKSGEDTQIRNQKNSKINYLR
jgi:hypothetical protein